MAHSSWRTCRLAALANIEVPRDADLVRGHRVGVQLDVLWRAAVMAVSHDADSAGPV